MLINKYNHFLFEVLVASYLYYYHDTSVLTDQEYDYKYFECMKNWKKITHRHKNLIKKNTNTSSLFYLREQHYPQGLLRIAMYWKGIVDA